MNTYDLLEALDIEAEIEKSIEKNRQQEPSSAGTVFDSHTADLSDDQIENLKRFAERENAQ